MPQAPRKQTAGSRVLLGEITGAHGIRGDVVLRTFTEDPDGIAAYGPLENESGSQSFTVRVLRSGDKGTIASIAGITDRTAAEKLRGTKLYVDRSRLPEAAEGEYYQADLIGLEAVSADGTVIGNVVAIPNFGAGDLIEIRLKDQKRSELLPFTEAFVLAVDLSARRMTIAMPDFVIVEPQPSDADQADD